jgi:DNA-directed RNA polymerase subunit N (RpoN/RPB10)
MSEFKAPEKLQELMYALTKNAARNSFNEFLEDWGITRPEYEEIKEFISDLGVKTYC